MERVEKTIFLSYRRTNVAWALAIFQNLTQHGHDVFFDYDGIASGDFEQVVLGNIKARAHFLVLLTPSALERCAAPEDWLRREIETALTTRRNIVPLLLEGFDFQTPSIADRLTGSLAPLKQYNGIRVPADYFDEALERLRSKYLNVPLTAVLHPASQSAQRAAAHQKTAARAARRVQEKELMAQEWIERGVAATDPGVKVRLYTEAIRLKPDNPLAYYNRAWALNRSNDSEGAIRDYSKAIQLDPGYADAYYNRATVHGGRNHLLAAIKDYSEAIRLNPNYPKALNNRGVALDSSGEIDAAIQDYSEAIRLKPDFADAFNNRAAARERKRDADGAMKDYDRAIQLKPDYADALHNRGVLRRSRGDEDGAREDEERARRFGFGS